jgi:putative transposase
MVFDPDTHHRKSIRLEGYDYSQAGMYYVTICAKDRKHLLGTVADGRVYYSEWGRLVQDCWLAIPQHFDTAELDECVVMPNHVHGIIVHRGNRGNNDLGGRQEGTACRAPTKSGARHLVSQSGLPAFRERRAWCMAPQDELRFSRPIAGNVATIVRSFKSAATRAVRQAMRDSAISLWQRDYYERIIRGESELNSARRYIRENPKNWLEDKENVM